jgi:transcription elongation factor Elf1
MSDAEVNIDLNIKFECPHCDAKLNTSDYCSASSIETGTLEIECSSCGKIFNLNINESY